MGEVAPGEQWEQASDDIAKVRALAQRIAFAFGVLRSQVGTVLFGAGAGLAAGIVVALLMQPEFRSTSRLVPYRSSSVAPAGLSGLAGLAGVRFSGLGLDQTVTPELFPEVVRSLDFRIELAEERIQVPSLRRDMKVVDYLRFLADSTWRGRVYGYTIGMSGRLLSAIGAIDPAMGSTALKQGDGPKVLSAEHVNRLTELNNRIRIAYDKKTSLITITADMPDATAAAQTASLVSSRLRSTVIKYETSKATEQLAFLQRQVSRSKERYWRAEEELARFLDSNRVLLSATSIVKRTRLEREVTLSFEVLSEVTRQLEQVALKVNQDTPAFAVLEQPIVEPRRNSPKRTVLVLAGLAMGLLIASAAVLFRSHAMTGTEPEVSVH